MIEVSHLTKSYGPRDAISDLNFTVKKGEIVGFLGPNGAGKSTTMKIITGFMPATGGTVKLDGFDVFENPIEVKRRVGFLPENPPVYDEMIVEDYLKFAARIQGVPGKNVKSCVDEALEKTSTTHVAKRIIGNLSKGYRQRVGIAQALVHKPPVLILDEPTVGLDPTQIIEIRGLIQSLAGDHTIILSTHILPEVTATCPKVIVISRGKIVAQDTVQNLTQTFSDKPIYRLVTKSPNQNGIEKIKKIMGVKGVDVHGTELHIELDPNAGEVRDQIVQSAVESNIGVLEFQSSRLSLEEVFVRLTSQTV